MSTSFASLKHLNLPINIKMANCTYCKMANIRIPRIMSTSFASLKHLNLPINIKMANCLYLRDSYTTKFDFMKYAFAKLAVAWL